MAVEPLERLEDVGISEPTGPVIHADLNPWPRRLAWLVGAAVVAAIGLIWLNPGFPEAWVVGIEDWFAGVETWIIDNQATHWLFVYILNPIEEGITALVDGVQMALERMTWLGFTVAACGIAGMVAGWRLALLTAAGVATFGVLGVWEDSIETLSLVLVAVGVSLVIGIPLGIWAGRKPTVERGLRAFLDAMQTIPAYSYLLPCVLLFGIGAPPALIATVIFALPPAVRLTAMGIRNVSPTALEVSDSYGSTPRQTLSKVQIPLAKPSMMLGVNQTIMMALGMVVIAAVVGAPGLGRQVLDGLKQLDVGEALNGGIAIVMMAIVLDRVTTAWSQRGHAADDGIEIAGRRFSRRAMWITTVAAIIGAVVIGREVLRQQDWPEAWTTSVAAPANAIVEWSRDNLTGVRRLDLPVPAALAARSAAGPARRGAVVDGRWRRCGDRMEGVGCAPGGLLVPVHLRHRPAGCVGPRDGDAHPGADRGADRDRDRDPDRGARLSSRRVRARDPACPRRDADDAGIRLPRPRAADLRSRAGAGGDRRRDLRPAGGYPAH